MHNESQEDLEAAPRVTYVRCQGTTLLQHLAQNATAQVACFRGRGALRRGFYVLDQTPGALL